MSKHQSTNLPRMYSSTNGQFHYNQNLFEEQQKPNHLNSVYMNFNASSFPDESEQLKKVEKEIPSESQELSGNFYKQKIQNNVEKIYVHKVHKTGQPTSLQTGIFQHNWISQDWHSNANQYFNNTREKIFRPIPKRASFCCSCLKQYYLPYMMIPVKQIPVRAPLRTKLSVMKHESQGKLKNINKNVTDQTNDRYLNTENNGNKEYNHNDFKRTTWSQTNRKN